MDLEVWAGFGRLEWFCKRKGNSMTKIRVYIFGRGFPQATASLATCYNAVEGSYPPKSNNKVRKLDWRSNDVRRPSIGVQPSNNVSTSNGGQPWPGYIVHINQKHCYISTLHGRLKPTHDDVIKWKKNPRYWTFVRGIHRLPVNSPARGQWRRAFMFSLICTWINGYIM